VSVPATDLAFIDLDGARAHQDVKDIMDALPSTPIIGVTDDGSAAGRRRAAELAVSDFVLSPIEPAELRMRIAAALSPVRLRRLLADRSSRLTEALRYRTAELGTVQESLSLLAAVADFHDDDTDQHAHRVGLVSAAIGRALELPEEFVAMLADAAPLHDIGKVGISRRILLKPGKLSPSEWLHMQQHVEIGGQILAAAQSPVLVLAGEIARTHHEHWDGNGYTAGLAGKEIPLSGRIVAVADVWDTLTHDRPYRRAWDPERAADEIRTQAGAHFDPTVVAAFSSLDHATLSQQGDADRHIAA
jgi:putative two-component system response regulator